MRERESLLGNQGLSGAEPLQSQFRLAAIEVKYGDVKPGLLQAERVSDVFGQHQCFAADR